MSVLCVDFSVCKDVGRWILQHLHVCMFVFRSKSIAVAYRHASLLPRHADIQDLRVFVGKSCVTAA